MFWPGLETAIGGRYATYWQKFDDDLPNEKRVAQVVEWLGLPEGQRPSFLTLYFSDVDSAGHRYGPDSAEVREAVAAVDSIRSRRWCRGSTRWAWPAACTTSW